MKLVIRLAVLFVFLFNISDATTTPSTTSASASAETNAGAVTPTSMMGMLEANNLHINWNYAADFLLEVVRDELKKMGKEQIVLPDINYDFLHRKKMVKTSGSFVATHGWFRNLSSIRRMSDVYVVTTGTVYTLNCSLGLGDVEMGYDDYEVKFLHVGPSGKIEGSVGNNSIHVIVQFEIGKAGCRASLKELRVLELNDLKFNVTGFGAFNDFVSKQTNEAIQKRKGDIVKRIELELAKEVDKDLKLVTCSNYFTSK